MPELDIRISLFEKEVELFTAKVELKIKNQLFKRFKEFATLYVRLLKKSDLLQSYWEEEVPIPKEPLSDEDIITVVLTAQEWLAMKDSNVEEIVNDTVKSLAIGYNDLLNLAWMTHYLESFDNVPWIYNHQGDWGLKHFLKYGRFYSSIYRDPEELGKLIRNLSDEIGVLEAKLKTSK